MKVTIYGKNINEFIIFVSEAPTILVWLDYLISEYKMPNLY